MFRRKKKPTVSDVIKYSFLNADFQNTFHFRCPFCVWLAEYRSCHWTILLLGSKEFWGKWHPDASLMGHMYISLCSVLL